MVTAVELDDFIASGESTRETNGAHAGFGAGIRQAHLLHAGHSLADQLGQGNLERIGNAETGAPNGSGLDGGDDFRVGMAQNSGPPGADIINVFVAIHVPDAAPRSAVHEEGLAANGAKGAHGGVDPSGNELQRFGKERLGFGSRYHGPSVAVPSRGLKTVSTPANKKESFRVGCLDP
ncbi:MAG: hypothetical protein BWX84_01584 [Verrucomicrobia bacterium ADurb.Bin118]|nr:MAG: hypothetical protein BWX84_01584 [Verrucomicrobia bacterium ADurb.Bin118]